MRMSLRADINKVEFSPAQWREHLRLLACGCAASAAFAIVIHASGVELAFPVVPWATDGGDGADAVWAAPAPERVNSFGTPGADAPRSARVPEPARAQLRRVRAGAGAAARERTGPPSVAPGARVRPGRSPTAGARGEAPPPPRRPRVNAPATGEGGSAPIAAPVPTTAEEPGLELPTVEPPRLELPALDAPALEPPELGATPPLLELEPLQTEPLLPLP